MNMTRRIIICMLCIFFSTVLGLAVHELTHMMLMWGLPMRTVCVLGWYPHYEAFAWTEIHANGLSWTDEILPSITGIAAMFGTGIPLTNYLVATE